MNLAPHATLQAIAASAVEATAASAAWLLEADHERLFAVVTVHTDGSDARGALDLTVGPGEGTAGYVLASGQPLALQIHPRDSSPWATRHPLVGRIPRSILAVPCQAGDGVVGVLELLDKAGGPFSFDDVEVATLLGGIAAVALAEAERPGPAVPDPEELVRRLARVSAADPLDYARVALMVDSLLTDG